MIARRTGGDEILSSAYGARIQAIEALGAAGLGAADAHARLRAATGELRLSVVEYGEAEASKWYSELADLIDLVSLLVEWRSSVLNAVADAQRFATAAKERAAIWLEQRKDGSMNEHLEAVANEIAGVSAISEVARVAVQLAGVPLPISLYSIPKRERGGRVHDYGDEKETPGLQVAFLKFTIDGTAVEETHHLAPGEMHDLDVEVRVSRWPKGATALMLEPVSIEPPGTYQLPTFSIEAPLGEGPFRLIKQGRAVLNVPQHFGARPYEFKYVARFLPSECEQPIDTVGQRTLTLQGMNPALRSLTGYANLDRKLIEIRDQLRPTFRRDQQDLVDALTLAMPLVNLAGQARQDNLFKSVISEPDFQKEIRRLLRARPSIGAALDEHPHAAGGITDLSFRGIRLELKVESGHNLTLQDCERFLEQTVSYVAANGKRIGVLCVLDCSPKKRPAFPAEDGIGVQMHQATETPIFVLTILLQGNLASPSDFSR
jgi:hypothetical protein